MRHWTVLAVVCAVGCSAPSLAARRRSSVPPIASILGLQVGVSGQAALERRLGKGFHSVGGHPNGRLSWRTRSPEGLLDTDGFSFVADDSLALEELNWSLKTNHKRLPTARLPRRAGWLGTIVPGMSEAEVRRLTAKLPPPKKHGNTWEWTAEGYFRPMLAQQQPYFTEWSAELEFKKGRLDRISLSVE